MRRGVPTGTIVKELRQEYQQSGGSEEIAVKIHHLLVDWLLQRL